MNDTNATLDKFKGLFANLSTDEKYYIIIGALLLLFFVIMLIRNRKFYKFVKKYNALATDYNELIKDNNRLINKSNNLIDENQNLENQLKGSSSNNYKNEYFQIRQEFEKLQQAYKFLKSENIDLSQRRDYYKNKLDQIYEKSKQKVVELSEEELEKLSVEEKAKIFDEKLDLFKESDLSGKSLLNFEEYKIYGEIVHNKDITSNFIISPQASMKSFIKQKNENSEIWKVFSNFYVDFLLSKRNKADATPFCVIEYNGGGHFGFNDTDETKILQIRRNDYLKLRSLFVSNILFFVIDEKQIKTFDGKYDKFDSEKVKSLISEIALFLKDENGQKTLKERNYNYIKGLEKELNII